MTPKLFYAITIALFFMILIEDEFRVEVQDKLDNRIQELSSIQYADYILDKSYEWEMNYRINELLYITDILTETQHASTIARKNSSTSPTR